jgi:hypothetical protein
MARQRTSVSDIWCCAPANFVELISKNPRYVGSLLLKGGGAEFTGGLLVGNSGASDPLQLSHGVNTGTRVFRCPFAARPRRRPQ